MAQTVIRISCTDQTLKTVEAPVVSSGGIGENKVIFDFCPLWDGFSKVAVFQLNEDTAYQAVIGTDNSCIIPAEPLMSQGNLYIGVYGVNAEGVKRTTSLLKYKVAQGALEGVKPTEPTPEIYEQILAKIADVAYPEVPVQSVNGKSGKVILTPEDIGAQPAGNYIIGETDPTVPAWAKEATKPKYTAGEVGAEERGVTNTHNTSPEAHNDIRLLIEGLTARFNAVFDSTDIDLDQMSEIVAYIKDNASLIESVTTSKVNIADIVDNLTTNVKEKPLSAAQGVVLKDLIDKLQSAVNDKVGARHEHSATEITSGILPVSRGGTGMSAGQAPNAVINLNGDGDSFNAISTKSGALYATTDNGTPSFGTLPVAQGGTGATTAEMARASLGAAAATHPHSITELEDLSLATPQNDGLMSASDKEKLDGLDTTLETIANNALSAKADVKEFREDFEPHIVNKENPHGVTAAQVKALPTTGGTMTGAPVLTNNVYLKGKNKTNGDWNLLTVDPSNNVVFGDANMDTGTYIAIKRTMRPSTNIGAASGVDLGANVTGGMFKNIYGTNIYQNGKQVANKEDLPTDYATSSDISGINDNLEIIGNSALEAKADVKDLREDFSPHLSNKSNPHGVSAEQVGALPKSGGTMTGEIKVGQGDGYGVQLGTDGRINATDSSGGTTCTVSGVIGGSYYVGHGNFNTLIRGKASRPTYNGSNIALQSDLPTDYVTSTDISSITENVETACSNALEAKSDTKDLRESLATYETKTDASNKLAEAKTYTDDKVAALVNGAPDALNTLDELAAALKDNAGIVDALEASIGSKANASDLTNLQAQVNKKANDYSIEIYNGTGGNPKPVRFASFNYSTCNSKNGIAAKIGMVSGHGNGSSYAFLQDAIIRVSYTGTVEVDNFKYYGAATGAYDGAERQYGDIFWLIDTTNKIVDFYCLMGQYARVYQTPWKRLTYSTGGTVTQYTNCTVYSSGTKAWANNSDIALMSDIPDIDVEAIQNSVLEAKADVKDLREDFSPHLSNTSNPHNVTASQVGALSTGGGTVTGRVDIRGAAASQPLVVRGIAGSDGEGNVDALYLQYGANKAVHLGNSGAYTISSDGGTYSGTSAKATADGSGNNIVNTYATKTSLTSHTGKTDNPHSVTAAQTGALPLAGGLMNGSVKFQASSLPQKTLQYICGIDAFAEGGEMGWQSKGNFLAECLKTSQAGTDGILPARLRSYQDHTIAVSDPNSAVETGFYYINGAANRPPFSQSTNVDYRVLTTAYSDQWLQQIATDFRCTDVFVRRRENGTWTDWLKLAYSSEISGLSDSVETACNNALSAKSDVKDMRESLASYETTSAASNKLLEAKAYTDKEVGTAKGYTDTAISNLINSAPSTLDTLGEIATAMQSNADVVSALNTSIGTKANSSDLTSHTGNTSNPHSVTASQVGALSTQGGTLTGTLYAPVYKSDTTPAAIKPSDSNEVNFGSNANYIYFGYENRVGSAGAVNTYKFGTHSGAGGATSGKIECGEVVEGGTSLSSKYAPASLSTTVEEVASSVLEAQSDIKDMREEVIPLSRGGTGTSLAKTNNAIIRFSGSGNYFSKTATASGAMYATSANGAPTFGTLPIAQGGTGATSASGAPWVCKSGDTMTGPLTYSTASGNAITSNYISAGGGYSPNTGKYGVKLICCDQGDCQTGLGQDLTALPGGYELSIAGGRNAAGDTGYISFAMHSVNSTSYDRLGYFDNGGNFYTKGELTVGGGKGVVTGSPTTTTFSGLQSVRLCSYDDNNVNTAGFIINADGKSKFVHRRGDTTVSEDSYFTFDANGYEMYASGTKGTAPDSTPTFSALQNSTRPTFKGTNIALSTDIPTVASQVGALSTEGGRLSGSLDFTDGTSWITPFLLAFKNASAGPATYPYTGFYQWGDEWQVNARDASNTFVHNIMAINLVSKVANFSAVPTVNGSPLALKSDIPSGGTFITTYQGATYAEVVAAHNAGKAVFCKMTSGDATYVLPLAFVRTNSKVIFATLFGMCSHEVTLNSDNTWAYSSSLL